MEIGLPAVWPREEDVRRVLLVHGKSFSPLQVPLPRLHLLVRRLNVRSAPTVQDGQHSTHTAFIGLYGNLVLTQEVFHCVRGQ